MKDFSTKRIYESAESTDGIRVLVDRIWPRGISKEKAQLTVWMKEIAPSAELRKWFQHVPERFTEFKERYQAELQRDEAKTLGDREHIWQLRSSLLNKHEISNAAVILTYRFRLMILRMNGNLYVNGSINLLNLVKQARAGNSY